MLFSGEETGLQGSTSPTEKQVAATNCDYKSKRNSPSSVGRALGAQRYVEAVSRGGCCRSHSTTR
ncbi:hypothetical protein E2C01_047312 [Portunus trituberculatus]|uniref:Uncharacterized protein n=1 Tax=Portunus trituberculatus TaxID=210409 RepID=A0A5B7G3A5_PORTR|nr:hypothetical protein [Portunus trituberculatus]